MESVLLVMQIIALGAVTALCVYLIMVLIRVRNILDTVERDVKAISTRVIPVLDNLEIITDKVKIITEVIGDQVEAIKQGVGSLRQIADNMLAFENRVQRQLEEPVMDAVATFASIFKGIQSFLERIPFVGRLRA